MDNKSKIVGFLGKNPGRVFTMHELSLRLDIPYASFYRTVEDINDLLQIESIGRSKAIKLDTENQVIRSHLAIASDEESKEFKHHLINKITKELNTKNIVLLFGSYASKTQRKDGDIDLMVINKNKTMSFSKYELLYKVKINPIFVSKNEFKKMLREKGDNVGKQVLANHIVLNNPEKFWDVVLNGIR